MAYFNKVGLLILSDDKKQYMACVKNHFTSDYIFPGGQFEKGENDIDCLKREIREELSAKVDEDSLKFIGSYEDIAAGDPTKNVNIKLYQGKLLGKPEPSNEIIEFHWISKNDISDPRVSPIMKNKIIPDLVKRNILK